MKTLNAFLSLVMLATCFAHRILFDLMILLIVEYYEDH
jgi:hypothetical protein